MARERPSIPSSHCSVVAAALSVEYPDPFAAAMHILHRLLRRLNARIAELSWWALGLITLLHFATSWALLAVATEPAITEPSVFWYFYVVTATTVGYGDYSPETLLGRILTAAWVMPGGIGLFTAVIAKLITLVGAYWRRQMHGDADFSHVAGAVVVVGWTGGATERILRHLLSGEERGDRRVVLVAHDLATNPYPDRIDFVRVPSLSDRDGLCRAAVPTASRVLVHAGADGETLAAALAVTALNRRAHVVAYFDDAATAALLDTHCPQAECIVSADVDVMVRALEDPGSSYVAALMASTLVGATQFSLVVPDGAPSAMRFGVLFSLLKDEYGMTVLAALDRPNARDPELEGIVLNPPSDYIVRPSHTLYYIADRRIAAGDIAWSRLS